MAALAVALFVNLAWAWTRQYFDPQGNAGILSLISFRVVDPPWMPPDVEPSTPLVGLHHFGDLTLLLGYGQAANPYLNGYPSQYPPVGVLLLRAMGSLGYHAAFIAFVVLTLVPLAAVGWIWLARAQPAIKVTALALLVGLTLPTVTNYDRGSIAMAAIGGVAVSLLLYSRGRPVLAGVLFVAMVSLKPYLIILLIYPFLRGHHRFALYAAAGSLISNILLFFALPGGFADSIAGFLVGTSRYSGGDHAFSWVVLQSESTFGGLVKALDFFVSPTIGSEAAQSMLDLAILPGLIWLVVVAPLIAASRLPPWIPLFFAFATTMAVIPSSAVYTTAWACVAAIAFASRALDPFPPRSSGGDSLLGSLTLRPSGLALVRWTILTVLLCNLTPFTWSLARGELSVPATSVLPIWSLLLGTAAVWIVVLHNSISSRRRPPVNAAAT